MTETQQETPHGDRERASRGASGEAAGDDPGAHPGRRREASDAVHHRMDVLARYRPKLVAIARRVGLAEYQAEDAVHDAMLRVAEAPRELTDTELRSYAAKAVRNEALNLLRERAQHARAVEHATLRPDHERFEDRVLTRIVVSDLLAAMTVSESPATVEILVLWTAGYTHAEIAELFGMSISAIQSRHHRALKKHRDATV